MNADHSTSAEHPPRGLQALDTTRGSAVHWFCQRFARPDARGEAHLPRVYALALAVAFVPLCMAAAFGPLPLWQPAPGQRLTFLQDWNVLFMFLVSFPSLVLLSVTEQHVLATALGSVQRDGTLTLSEREADELAARWQRHFVRVNHAGLAVGCVLGVVVAYCNKLAYAPREVGFWIAVDGELQVVGFVFLFCVFLFYALIPLYVARNVAITLLFRDVVARSRLRLLPLHPDKSGGLRPVGRLGLRNQYVLTLFGLNVVLLVVISLHYLPVPPMLHGLIAAAVIAYLLLGPLVFVAPLLPFRAGMLRTKTELMAEVAQRMRVELQRIRRRMRSGTITRKDEELIERLRKIGAVIDELPVWPFDATTMRKFLAAYVLPVLGSVAVPLVKFAAGYASRLLS